jgi:secondary thiamine-phosphate synthase enzyme
MIVRTAVVSLETQGNADIHDITEQLASAVSGSGLKNGTVTVFCPGSTSAIATIEYEPGALSDLRRLFDEIVAADREYAHNARWGDGNGHSHVRAALLGASLTVPVTDGRLVLGPWQQVIHVDFDTVPRDREVVLQLMGE